jgi:hypothetical protein
MAQDSTVTIHGSTWKSADIEEAVADCRGYQWKRERWVCRDALVQRTGTTSLYVGQRYDPEHYELVRGGWRHDHCKICWWTLSEGDDEHSVGFTDGRWWICSECYHHFIEVAHDTNVA